MRGAITLFALGIYLVALLGSLVGVFVLNFLLRRRLQESYPDLWHQIGSPTFLDILVKRDDGSLWTWLPEHGDGHVDSETRRLARGLRVISNVLIGSVAVAIVLALIGKVLR